MGQATRQRDDEAQTAKRRERAALVKLRGEAGVLGEIVIHAVEDDRIVFRCRRSPTSPWRAKTAFLDPDTGRAHAAGVVGDWRV
jgi:uncharacterized iron-regulated membrane protein